MGNLGYVWLAKKEVRCEEHEDTEHEEITVFGAKKM